MTDKELKKYTVDFINNETGSNRSNINSVMGKMLIKYAEVFQNRVKELERINADGLSELNHINGDLIIENEKLRKENAELKEHHKNVCENLTDTHRNIREQLTNAKELLKEYYSLTYGETMTGLRSRTEKFLNEVDK